MYYLGLDPGKSGGWAIVDHTGKLIESEKFTDWHRIRQLAHLYKGRICHCAIEKVASKSAQGVKSVFTFGMNYGGWLAFLELANISHTLIPPNRWQRMFLGSFPKGESKARSVDFINRRYPHARLKKSDHGISDAICLALYSLVIHHKHTGKRLHRKTKT